MPPFHDAAFDLMATDAAPDAIAAVHAAVRRVLDTSHPPGGPGPSGRLVLAVSGGIDSSVLLDACATLCAERIAAVATFDHGTGAAAREAVAHVRVEGARRGLRVVAGAAGAVPATESAWREARWRFLRSVARDVGASAIATGHSRDDQVETVAMRVLRDAGPRGLAGLAAGAPDVVRPLLEVPRPVIHAYAVACALRWLEDPSNASPRHRRNRVRHELLPLLRRARPALDAELLAVGGAAAAWRGDVERFVDAHVRLRPDGRGGLLVATPDVVRYDPDVLAVLWPAIAARAGVRLDRRGTVRLVEFTIRIAAGATVGAEIQLSGAVRVEALRGEIVIRAGRPATEARVAPAAPATVEAVPLVQDVLFGAWQLRAARRETDSPWGAYLPSDVPLAVRAWRPGDRMCAEVGRPARRVKRFFADAHVPARDRAGWPVVLAGDDIVWIPGVRRSDAATDRPGRPGVHYLCERIDG